ncbi:16S rRNA (cytosine(1402)-N(4))-methyltransferase RsmH [Weissella diestrammenae]|uniref:Ribosomal RNA small subunit methyltransferase H n=1 Tax=Weissella diestrammenae TaxID=1162633 RepID=A0A7G9T7H1_9LACO|nr:16S rRNA (cytosine(1402)-N(4))-methyltransferase RsmH [Weissella diestrammenae]MCM0582402.1 16S rRNA (cytosine(1402)-N(4))-methyltransferase RsmH [Weissella diestrammenae]QNN76046.1 16S rRNA (cytosine(1402)-N(4))-methyltransferase RsmH [Weissella diestrammenae]
MVEFNHVTVLLNEAIDNLAVKPNGIYVDATLGGGGHSKLLASHITSGKLWSFDQDITAINYNQNHLTDELADGKIAFIQDNFRHLTAALAKQGVHAIDGIVYDLGVSSPQFDDGQRGFSYNYDAPLDMRMDQSQTLNARTIVNTWRFQDLMRIFSRYGEEKFAKQIARKIEQAREVQPIETTFELVEIIKSAIPMGARRTGGHPAKKTFQAIRIAVNDELGAVEESLQQALDLLKVNGRISVITFHSLEDRLVKTMFKERSSLPDLPAGLPVIPENMQPDFRLVTRKPITASEIELADNHRAHSAKLRVIERIR